MDIKHTQEPWKFLEQGDADEYCLVTADGLKWVIAFRINGEMMPEKQRANARRIVACVNACAGISTENLKDNKPIIELARDYNATIKQRDNAWEEGHKIREAIKANPEESTFDEVVRVVNQRDLLLTAIRSHFTRYPEDISGYIRGVLKEFEQD